MRRGDLVRKLLKQLEEWQGSMFTVKTINQLLRILEDAGTVFPWDKKPVKVGFYLGSFNPWHRGHEDVLQKAMRVFDKIVIMQMSSDKGTPEPMPNVGRYHADGRVEVLQRFDQSVITALGNYILGAGKYSHDYAIIRGLRNAQDLESEKVNQYWYEDLGIKMPIVYFISDKSLVHISSSAIRSVNKFTEK